MAKLPAFFLALCISVTGALSAPAADAAGALAEYACSFRQSGRRMVLAVIPPADRAKAETYRDLLAALRDGGVETVDLAPVFAEAEASGSQIWCRTDTHPAPAALAAAAKAVALHLTDGVLPQSGKYTLAAAGSTICSGNLGGTEALDFVQVSGNTVLPDSTLWVTGDSNVLVYHDGIDLPVHDAGFADHLAYFLDTEVSLLGMRGCCADQLRGEIYRRSLHPSNGINRMRTAVFLLGFEQFAEGANRWIPIPAPGMKMEK